MQIWKYTCELSRWCHPEPRQQKPHCSDLEPSEFHQDDGSLVMGRVSCNDDLQALFASFHELSFFFSVLLLTPLLVGASAVCVRRLLF